MIVEGGHSSKVVARDGQTRDGSIPDCWTLCSSVLLFSQELSDAKVYEP